MSHLLSHSGNLVDSTVYSLPSLSFFASYFHTGVHWIPLPNKQLDLKFLSLGLLLRVTHTKTVLETVLTCQGVTGIRFLPVRW